MMTIQQREDLNYVLGKISVLEEISEGKAKIILTDVHDCILSMLESDKVMK